MTLRYLPPPDIYTSCPDHGPILPHYRGHFEAVFIMLHPFFRAGSRTLWETCTSKAELHAGATPVSWAEVQQLGDFSSLAQVDIGLRTVIGGLRRGYADQALADRVIALEEQGVFRPDEGYLSPLLEPALLSAIEQLGQRWLWVTTDEMALHRKLEWIDDFRKDDRIDATSLRLYTPDKSLLIATHWDSHFSFLCASHMTIERILAKSGLEGFFCDPATPVYWSIGDRA